MAPASRHLAEQKFWREFVIKMSGLRFLKRYNSVVPLLDRSTDIKTFFLRH
jgi:hypothetical protein